MLFSSPLLALVLATSNAEAKAVLLDLEPGVLDAVRVGTVIPEDGTVASVSASVESDAGDETVTLTESDAWLHGGAELKSLPTKEATGTLTVYDASNNVLATFSGTLGADGTVSFLPGAKADTGAGCGTKTGCDATSDASLDLEVLAAEVFPSTSGGYDVTFDLNGADTYSIAYADLTLTEGDVATTCDKELRECVSTGTSTITKAEVDWDAAGALWTGSLAVVPEGLVEVKVKTYDANGKKIESATSRLGMPWEDGGYGVNALATDEDPLTSLAVLGPIKRIDKSTPILSLTVVSQGWSSASTMPVDAQVELTNGETITIPANSYQVTARPEVFTPNWGDMIGFDVSVDGEPGRATASITRPGVYYLEAELEATFGLLTDNGDGTWSLAVAAYSNESGKLPDGRSIKVTPVYKEGASASDETEAFDFTFDDEVAIVFANEVTVSEDPLGIDVSGKVSLLEAATSKGKQKTLSKGRFYATFSRDEDGDLALGGADKDVISAKGDILIGGEPIDFELTDTNKDGVIDAPPAIVLRNGTGTRNTSCTTGQTQQAQLL